MLICTTLLSIIIVSIIGFIVSNFIYSNSKNEKLSNVCDVIRKIFTTTGSAALVSSILLFTSIVCIELDNDSKKV